MSRKTILIVILSSVIIVSCILITHSLNASKKQTILSTHILFRHGEKTPTLPLGIINCDLCEELGYGELTNNGAMQLYKLGVFLRKIYSPLFPEHGFYRGKHWRIRSSDAPRTIMSLKAFMAGFFPAPMESLNTLPNGMQPFHFDVDLEGIYLTVRLDGSCPRLDQLRNESISHLAISSMLDNEKDLFSNLSDMFETPMGSFFDFRVLCDTLNILEQFTPNDVPKWAVDVLHNYCLSYWMTSYEYFTYKEESVKYRSGMVITEIVNNMNAVAEMSADAKIFNIYSGHDVNIYSMAKLLGVVDQLPQEISNGAAILFDLLAGDDVDDEPRVQVSYTHQINNTFQSFELLINAQITISLGDFVQLTKQYFSTKEELRAYCSS